MKIISLILCAFFLFGCVTNETDNDFENQNHTNESVIIQDDTNESIIIKENISIEDSINYLENSNVSKQNNKFSFDLFNRLNTDNENVFFSGFSISSAMAMVYEGADKETKEQIQDVFYFYEKEKLRQSYLHLYNILNKNENNILNVANALWIQDKYKIINEYENIIKKYYQGKTTNLDFINNPEQSRNTINQWVEEKTNEKIKDLIPEGIINAYTRLILTNAIYFKGDWEIEFDELKTRKQDFYLKNQETIQVDMMQNTNSKYYYFEDDLAQVIKLNYKENEASMVLFLPKQEYEDQFYQEFDLEKYEYYLENLKYVKVDLFIPKFEFQTKYSLEEDLQQMGMPLAFSDNADFSKINEQNDLSITSVIHQAYLKVDEKGTEAAAATGVVIGVTSIGPQENPIFRADRPFTFLIKENTADTILFMGKINSP